MTKKRLQKICLLLLVLLSVYSPIVQASSKENINLTIEVSRDGLPLVNKQFMGEKLTRAYEKIKDGNFSETDTSSASWQAMRQTYEISDDVIEISPGISFGPGRKLSDTETESVLKALFSHGEVTKKFLQSINGASVGVTGGTTSNSAQFFFRNPENAGKSLTNASGKAVARLDEGYYAIFDSDGVWLKFIHLTADESLKLDLSNLASSGLSAEITNLSENAKNNVGQYVVEYGKEIIYQLTISKDLLDSDAIVTISPKANLVIDEMSIPFTTSLLENPINPMTYGIDMTGDSLSIAEKKKELSAALYNSPITSYSFSVPATGEDLIVEIKAHLESQINLEAGVIGLTAAAEEDEGDQETLSLKIGGVNGDVLSTYQLPITLSNATQMESYTSTESVMSSGINFVVGDVKETKLLDQHKYILGKEVEETYYLYQTDETWKKVGSEFKNSDLTSYKVFGGNREYIIGSGESSILPLVTTRTNYEEEKQTAINQSVIQIRGLGSGENYFLYQVQAPEGYEADDRLHYFDAYSNQRISPNGSIINETSIGTAKDKDVALNSQLPAYEPGVQDYHLLNANLQAKAKRPSISVIISLAVVVIVLVALAILLMKLT